MPTVLFQTSRSRRAHGRELRFAALLTAAAAAVVGFSGAAQAAGGNMAVDPTGRIVVAGTSNNTFAIARFKANGTLDPSFGDGGRARTSFGAACSPQANAVAIDSSGQAIVV